MAGNKSVYVIGIGGTGMRCIESFIHLCAIGMYDNTTVHMLAIDTDKDNGNFQRLSRLVDTYNQLNGGKVKTDTLFSAKIEYYQFSPDYSKSDCNFNNVIDKRSTDYIIDDEDDSKARLSDLVDLFIRPEVGEMPLQHGYRAQTQMGSMLMYYAILAEAYRAKTKESVDLRRFLYSIVNAGGGAQIFVYGSVFGGTGASTIPIIPHAFGEAAKIMFGNNVNIIDGNHFGSVVLTNYFTFNISDSNTVVAKADKFELNSQAALRFYKNDKTVNDVYKRMYLIGRDNLDGHDIKQQSVATGGATQCNPVDYLELIAAFAAYDFFKQCDTNLSELENNDENKIVFRAIEADGSLTFSNFTEDADIFMRKLGIMTAASALDSAYDFFENLRRDAVNFDEKDIKPLKTYFQMFGPQVYSNSRNEKFSGWINQMFESAENDGFQGAFFQPQFMACETSEDFRKYKFNERLYSMETPPKFSVGLLTNKFDVVKSAFNGIKPENDKGLESLIERTYLTLRKLYFNE